jgi:hypothetical protein
MEVVRLRMMMLTGLLGLMKLLDLLPNLLFIFALLVESVKDLTCTVSV